MEPEDTEGGGGDAQGHVIRRPLLGVGVGAAYAEFFGKHPCSTQITWLGSSFKERHPQCFVATVSLADHLEFQCDAVLPQDLGMWWAMLVNV